MCERQRSRLSEPVQTASSEAGCHRPKGPARVREVGRRAQRSASVLCRTRAGDPSGTPFSAPHSTATPCGSISPRRSPHDAGLRLQRHRPLTGRQRDMVRIASNISCRDCQPQHDQGVLLRRRQPAETGMTTGSMWPADSRQRNTSMAQRRRMASGSFAAKQGVVQRLPRRAEPDEGTCAVDPSSWSQSESAPSILDTWRSARASQPLRIAISTIVRCGNRPVSVRLFSLHSRHCITDGIRDAR